ncbi:PucR family transcriptional regulator [Streptococcus pluranimalium]|uniref:PucR family transcriptional regulator n=1 Tax=Streptococcus pluranimalium TaxID=82348 RepID=UPI003F690EFF
MQLINLLQLKQFSNASLLTGDIGITNEIESVMIIEALDIEKWAVRHQLLLTSFVAFQNKSQKDINDFFHKISAIGISGIVLKTKRFIDEIPTFFLDLCLKYQIPLIEIPPNVSYESVILSIHEPLLNYESFLLRSYYDASKTFSNFVNPRFTYEEVINAFTNFTSLPISISISERNFSFSSDQFGQIPDVPHIEYEVLNHFAQHRYFIKSYQLESGQEMHYLHIKQLVQPYRYHFFIQLENNSIDHSLILIIEKFLEILGQKLDADYYRKNEIFLHKNKTISAILFGINRDAYDLEILLQEIDLYQSPNYQVLLLTFPKNIEKEQLKTVKDTLATLDRRFVYYESKNTLVYIFNFDQKVTPLEKNHLKPILPKINKVHYYLSKSSSYQDIQKLFNTCLKMKQFNDSFCASNFMDENDLGVFNFLINIPSENYDAIIPEDLKQLFERKLELFETLHCFISNHLNYGATATELYLHPKTIRYRINKVEELLDLDLNNPLQLTNYTIGCILLNLRKEK